MIIAHLLAASENNVIGKNNQLPWHLPDDFKFFKNITWGLPVIMGRKTFESLGKPLPGRINIVITANSSWSKEGVITASSPEDALVKAEETDCNVVLIIGGGEVFRQSMGIINTIYLTRVHTIAEGDVFYPEINMQKWTVAEERFHPEDEKHQYAFTFQTLKLKDQ